MRTTRSSPVPIRLVAPLYAWPLFLAGGAAAAIIMVDPVDITFESTAPYYEPGIAVVPAGTPVRWINHTASPHSVQHDGCLAGESCAFQSVAVPPDSSLLIAPLPPGRYTYHCELHPIMRGTLVVVDQSESGSLLSSPEHRP